MRVIRATTNPNDEPTIWEQSTASPAIYTSIIDPSITKHVQDLHDCEPLPGKATDYRHTPPEIMDSIRECLDGRIDLDPCSDWIANKTVGARSFYSEHGLVQPWFGNVYLNWPGSLALPFAQKAAERSWDKIAVMLFQWDHSTQWMRELESFADNIVLLHKRLKFCGKDVGRSQAIAFAGVEPWLIEAVFDGHGTVVYL